MSRGPPVVARPSLPLGSSLGWRRRSAYSTAGRPSRARRASASACSLARRPGGRSSRMAAAADTLPARRRAPPPNGREPMSRARRTPATSRRGGHGGVSAAGQNGRAGVGHLPGRGRARPTGRGALRADDRARHRPGLHLHLTIEASAWHHAAVRLVVVPRLHAAIGRRGAWQPGPGSCLDAIRVPASARESRSRWRSRRPAYRREDRSPAPAHRHAPIPRMGTTR